MEMGSIILLGALVVLSATSQVYCRAVDDMDNSIQPRSESYFDKRDRVIVSRPPPDKVTQTLGAPVEIVCEVIGSPLPSIQWIQGEGPLDEVESFESNAISESSPNAIVRVRSVLVIDHQLTSEKTYTCVGRNGGNYAHASTVVYPEHKGTVLSDILLHKSHAFSGPRKPRIIYSYTQYMDTVDSNVILPCRSVGRPRPEIYWMNSEGVLIEDEPRFKVLPNGDLLIQDLKWEDMGVYKCIARNTLGKDSIETFVYPVSKE